MVYFEGRRPGDEAPPGNLLHGFRRNVLDEREYLKEKVEVLYFQMRRRPEMGFGFPVPRMLLDTAEKCPRRGLNQYLQPGMASKRHGSEEAPNLPGNSVKPGI